MGRFHCKNMIGNLKYISNKYSCHFSINFDVHFILDFIITNLTRILVNQINITYFEAKQINYYMDSYSYLVKTTKTMANTCYCNIASFRSLKITFNIIIT